MRNKFDKEHLLSLADNIDCGICPPPMDAQTALYELKRYFLGDDWSVSLSISARQANTEIVAAIEQKYKGCKVKKNRSK